MVVQQLLAPLLQLGLTSQQQAAWQLQAVHERLVRLLAPCNSRSQRVGCQQVQPSTEMQCMQRLGAALPAMLWTHMSHHTSCQWLIPGYTSWEACGMSCPVGGRDLLRPSPELIPCFSG